MRARRRRVNASSAGLFPIGVALQAILLTCNSYAGIEIIHRSSREGRELALEDACGGKPSYRCTLTAKAFPAQWQTKAEL
jgi:hypothetical protein